MSRYQDRVDFLGTEPHRPDGSRAVKLFDTQTDIRCAGVRLCTQLHRQMVGGGICYRGACWQPGDVSDR